MDPKTIVILSYWRLGNPGSHGKHHGLRVFFPMVPGEKSHGLGTTAPAPTGSFPNPYLAIDLNDPTAELFFC
jgi:hypothetical protein